MLGQIRKTAKKEATIEKKPKNLWKRITLLVQWQEIQGKRFKRKHRRQNTSLYF